MASVHVPLGNFGRVLLVVLSTCGANCSARDVLADPVPSTAQGETVSQALCRLIDGAAAKSRVPVAFLTRLIWQESRFRTDAISPAGAQGVAQFMPGTAQDRGLGDPFDPEQAIPASAALLADLARRFGNFGLAAAAYNGGPARVAAWLNRKGALPLETQDYVLRITGRSAEDWAVDGRAAPLTGVPAKQPSCLALAGDLRRSPARSAIAEAVLAPWGVQLAGNFSKSLALASYGRALQSYKAVLGNVRPMVIGTRLRSRGFRAFYRIRVPADTRQAADDLCNRIRSVRGSCVVLRS